MDRTGLCTIVGMGPGIGYAVARRFSQQGFRIGMIARDAAALRSFEQSIPNSQGIAADVSDAPGLAAAVTALGPTEVLVYNASTGHRGSGTELKIEDAVADFRVNIGGLLTAVQTSVPAMRAARKGTILITGGGLARDPMPSLTSLSIGKAAQRNLSFSLAGELEAAGIHVATITVCGFVQPGTFFDPDKIAATYWRIHSQPPGEFMREVTYAHPNPAAAFG